MKRQYVMKRTLTVLTTAVMIVASIAFAAVFGTDAYAESSSGKMIAGPDGLKEGVNTENARLVYYGDRYWYVIGYDREGVAAGSGEITLLSKDSIKSTYFDKDYKAVYSSSNLKNEIEAYTNDKLSAGEKSVIVSRDLSAINARAKGDLKWWFNNFRTVDEVLDNPVEGAMLWPLSAKEATEVNENIRKTGTGYWLRSLGVPEYEERYWYGLEEFDVYVVPAAMATVWDDGSVDIQAEKENTTYWHGMRPAFKLNKNDIVMVSAATGGKESAEDGTLTEAGEATEKKLKLTLKDDAHKDFYVNPCDVSVSEAGLTVKYSSAVTGDNEYISAIIKGADGSIKQYGRLAKATEASGTATIKGLPTDASGKVSLPEGDKLYVFNEQYNGDEKTDYVSNLREIGLTGHNWVFDDLKWDYQTGDVEASYHCSIDGNHFTTAKGDYKIEDIAPTCEEKGKQMQILSISAEKSPDGKVHSKSIKKSDQGEPLDHVYNHFFGFRWTGDATSGYSKAEAIFACDRDYSHKKYVEAEITTKVQEPTCTAIGRTLYGATLSADERLDGEEHWDAKYAKAKPRLGHDWGEVTYTWSDDNRTVTATRVCNRDENHVETETVATEATNITKEPTCKAEGEGNVKTKPFTNEAFSEQTKTGVTIPIDPGAHDWKEVGRQENPNECGGYVTEFKCELCGEEKEEVIGGSAHDWTDYIVDVEPTCTEPGEQTRHCRNCSAHDLDGIETIDPTGHSWKFVDFTWTGNETDGYEKAIANYVCEHDANHKMTANAVIREEVTDPTCTAGGKTVYTASISAADSPDETEQSESKDAEATDPVPHEWKYSGSMVWTGNETDGYTKAVARYKCKYGCGETAEVEATITETEQEATCDEPGGTLYTAKVDEASRLTDEEVKDETKVVKDTEPLGHDWHFKDVIWTGDEESGFTKAQVKFVCENDESHEELVEAKLTEEVTEPTCAEEGYTMYMAKVDSKDSLNGAECTDVKFAKIKDATGHAWKLKGFTWTEDEKYGYRAEANYVCKHDGSHAESVGADIRKTEKAATCGEPGGTLYTATVDKDNSLTDAEVTEDKLVKKTDPTGKHNWSPWKVTKKATVNARGIKTRTCKTCGKKETKYIARLKVTGTLMAQATASGKTALRIKWTRVNNVSGYDIFMSKCNYKGKKYTPKKVKTIKGNKRFKWTKKKLKKRTAYKIYVKAYVMKNGKKSYVRTSPTVHVSTSGYRGSLTNPKSVSVTKKAVSIEKGKTYEIKAKANKLKSGKDLPSGHVANLRYLSTNKKIAAVNSSGKITARGKGKCTVYVYAANGVWKTVKVTVK